ncbi:hypothetical protein GSI_09655 [Ganoderma sinense ZZ0214-1]|uniref:Yippee domain-containing protein n=1 Tax=Ganoderma sinense ZZ0214-1 TaxID=1077348 RepID=A0A2G8S384_9APHY|nr:hypothetical protein GSI_09655 [Ganoderma sinense ZZ0214-1]
MSKLPSPSSPPSTSQLDPLAQAGPPRAFACAQCHTRVAHTARIVSTAYRGHAGKAALFSTIRNVALDPPSILLMDSGAYTIQEFICKACSAYLGWKFVRAHDGPERWKEGCFVLELDFVSLSLASASEDGPDDAEGDARRLAHGLHRRTMSAAPDVRRSQTPKGFRSHGVQAPQRAPRPQTQVLAPRRREEGEFDGGPFWTPR